MKFFKHIRSPTRKLRKTSVHPSASNSALLAVPLDIRRHIYSFCIPQNLLFNVSDHIFPVTQPTWYVSSALPTLLLLCHQITDEVKTILYGVNAFVVNLHGNGQNALAKRFTPKTREKMRRVLLILRPMGSTYQPWFRMDPEIWDGILANIVRLGVVAEQPKRSGHDWRRFGDAYEEDPLREWLTWIQPIFSYLVRSVPKHTEIVVDADEEEDTVQAVERIQEGRFRFQRLQEADFVFDRGKYSEGRLGDSIIPITANFINRPGYN
ncbi:hypothetical protein HD806DRAFT_543515 [Xylariaceae sp. AK1471]|nr:hypothetical protein HD806DRAFT_543515 [Xylariaceae sp. AK1471]